MIKINKRPLPEGVVIKKENDYRSGIVFRMLTEDCHGKCYICENLVGTDPTVDHIVSKSSSPELSLCWSNLLLACGHCNRGTKLNKYDGIINPTKVNPEEFIELSLDLDDELREIVVVHKVAGNTDVDITVNLLTTVYNGTERDMRQYASLQLRNKVSRELLHFRQDIENYKSNLNEVHKTAIKNRLADNSIFAAFKRGMLRHDPELHNQLTG